MFTRGRNASLIEVCSAEDGRARVRELARVRECAARGVDAAHVSWAHLPWEREPQRFADETLRALGIGVAGVGRVPSLGAPPWTPKALGSSLAIWLRADLGITLNGSTVSAWADQSGNGHHVSQATASKQPPVTASAINGKPALRGDGGTSSRRLDNGTYVTGTAHTVFVVYTHDGTAAYNSRAIDFQPGSNRLVGRYGLEHRAYNGAFLTGPASASGVAVVSTYKQSAAGGVLYINGTSAATNVTTVTSSTGISVMGNNSAGAEYMIGFLAEVVIMNVAASDADRQKVERYMGSRYGIAVS